jgi:PST family polysaccharide transporter
MRGENTAARVARSAVWVLATRWTVRLIGMVSVIVLARLLLPEDFGVVAIASTCILIIDGLSDFDVSKALIRSPELDRALLDTAWTLALARGVLAAVIMLLAAPLLAAFMNDARLAPVVSVLALTPVLYGLQNPKFVTFERALNFSRHSLVMVSQKLTSLAVSVSVALIYRNYWALILGTVAAALVNLGLSYLLIPHRPRFCLARVRELFAFSGWMSLESAISTLSLHLDNFIIGHLMGIRETGVYYMSRQIALLPTDNLIHPINHVLFPSFSEVAADRAQLRRIALEAIGITASAGLAICIGFALVADEFVHLVLGEQWVAIIPYLQILVPVLGLQAIFATAQPMVMAVGDTRALFVNAMLYSLIRLPAFALATVWFGLDGAVWSLVFSGSCYCLLRYRLMYGALQIGPLELWREIARPITATLAMVLVVMTLQRLTGHLPVMMLHPMLTMLFEIAAGGVAFCAVHGGLWILLGKPAGIERRIDQLFRRFHRGYSLL